MSQTKDNKRMLGFASAVSIGIGAIVGGGILVLGGVSIRETGSGAFLAFALNGVIALLTACSLAEMSALFPESGGIYTYAKRVLSIRAGFAFGWILWFAHLVASLLYALGFAVFFTEALLSLTQTLLGLNPRWLASAELRIALSSLATGYYSIALVRSKGSGSNFENIVKLLVFLVLIVGGAIALFDKNLAEISQQDSPLLPNGWAGMGTAMGLTFIALPGFEVIAGVAGEIENPARNVPRAMFAALGLALLIYIPLLLLIVTVGVPTGESVSAWCGARSETCFADAAQQYLGRPGYWLVVVAAIFSTLSALQANLLTSSRLVLQMAQDRTLPRTLSRIHTRYHSPIVAIGLNLAIVLTLLGIISTVDTAGSAAGLVFLIAYACSHFLSYLARKRSNASELLFRSPFFPLIPIFGGLACFC